MNYVVQKEECAAFFDIQRKSFVRSWYKIHECYNPKDAQKYVMDIVTKENGSFRIVNNDNGIWDDVIDSKIYKLVETVELNVTAKKEDYTEEEWDEEYGSEFDYIADIAFKEFKE